MHCPECKSEIKDHKKYCPECGALLILESKNANSYPEPSSKESEKDSVNIIEYAGFWRRFAALIIDDVILMFMITIFSFYFFATADPMYGEDFIFGFYSTLFVILISWLYYAGMESSKWQATIGKIAIGITVLI